MHIIKMAQRIFVSLFPLVEVCLMMERGVKLPLLLGWCLEEVKDGWSDWRRNIMQFIMSLTRRNGVIDAISERGGALSFAGGLGIILSHHTFELALGKSKGSEAEWG